MYYFDQLQKIICQRPRDITLQLLPYTQQSPTCANESCQVAGISQRRGAPELHYGLCFGANSSHLDTPSMVCDLELLSLQ